MRREWLMCLVAGSAPAADGPGADRIFLHGNVLTGEALTGAQPQRVAALALRGDRILAAGSDAQVSRLRVATTEVIDLRGAFAMPGFEDAHVHLAQAGALALQADLRGGASLNEMLSRVQAAAKRAAPGAWIRGGGWDHTLWQDPRLPSRADLDPLTGDHPAMFSRVDDHIAVANSAALKAWGLTRATPDPPGGRFDRDASGELTGILRETAKRIYEAKIPPPTAALRRQALEIAAADAIRHGVTSVQDYSSWDDFRVYEQMEREGKLPVRVSEWLTFNDPVAVLTRQRAAHRQGDVMLHTGMLKGFMDGSLGSHTAALNAPYSDDPQNSGITGYEQARLDEMTIERAQLGFHIGFHAIGDRAVSMALHAFAAAQAVLPPAQRERLRFRIEHEQVVTAADLDRQAALHVIASMQPCHLLTDIRWAQERLGAQRARYSYAWRSMLDHGIPLAFGTDYLVEPVSPFRGLYAAVTRMQAPDDPLQASARARNAVYFPAERLSIAQAIYAYTQGAAYAEGREDIRGRLAPGQLADFVVLDRDLLRATPEQIFKTRVLRTVVGGRTVFAESHER